MENDNQIWQDCKTKPTFSLWLFYNPVKFDYRFQTLTLQRIYFDEFKQDKNVSEFIANELRLRTLLQTKKPGLEWTF